jgi:hypothetical protein
MNKIPPGCFTIISPRWGFFSFGLGLLQLFHPDGVCIHADSFFTIILPRWGWCTRRFFYTIISPRWGSYTRRFFFTIISPRWGCILIDLNFLQLFHPDGVGLPGGYFFTIISPRWGCILFDLNFLQLFHPDGVDLSVGCFYNHFTTLGLVYLWVIFTIISPLSGWCTRGFFLQSFHPDGVAFYLI